MRGFIHMLRSTSERQPDSPVYTVMFAPIGPTGTGGAIKGKDLSTLDDLVEVLKSAHIGGNSIKEALSELQVNGSATIPYVELTERELRDLDLI